MRNPEIYYVVQLLFTYFSEYYKFGGTTTVFRIPYSMEVGIFEWVKASFIHFLCFMSNTKEDILKKPLMVAIDFQSM